MSAHDELIRLWREGTQEDRMRIVYLLKLARLREAQQHIEEKNKSLEIDSSGL